MQMLTAIDKGSPIFLEIDSAPPILMQPKHFIIREISLNMCTYSPKEGFLEFLQFLERTILAAVNLSERYLRIICDPA